jgi:hypothetical protein
MAQPLPTESIAAIATIIAALIAAAISFVNLTLTKEQKTSEFRQAWIDALRQDLATFFATARAFARANQELQHFGAGAQGGAPLSFTEQMISDLRYQIAETRYRVQLRLNPKEPEHVELLRLMQTAIDKQQSALASPNSTDEVLEAVERSAAFSTQILKIEWERVKQGELPFRVARNWVAPITFGASVLLVALLWLGKVHL